MPEFPEEKNCKNCGTALVDRYCYACGQRHHRERWSTPALFKQLFNYFTNIENGFLFTTKLLFTAPGKLIQDFWSGKTVVYYNPFRFMIVWTAINLLISSWIGLDDMIQRSMEPSMVDKNTSPNQLAAADQKFENWMNILVILLIPILSFATFILFKKRRKNYAEHLIMNSFVFGQQAFFSSFTAFIFYLFPSLFTGYFAFNFLLGVTYNSYVFKLTFREKLWIVVVKAILVAAIGMLALFALVFLFSTIALFFS